MTAMYFDTILTISLILQTLHFSESRSCQKCHPLSTDKINVHLIPHSHDDVGWLKTFDEYYSGTGDFEVPFPENAGVKYILDSTIRALNDNSKRRFIQVEASFFSRWWKDQNATIRKMVRHLVDSGQLEITNGGWSMNDEATTNYQSIIDQFTWGFRMLERTLGPCGRPKIGWQIDPFGHSKGHALLMKQFGFEALIIQRIDFKDVDQRKNTQNLDFLWKTSDNLEHSELFTMVLPDSYSYTYTSGFCFDILCTDKMNETGKKETFEMILEDYTNYYKTPNVLIPMGNDFTYQVADINFNNTDQLIESFENDRNYNVFYSTPSCYVRAVKEFFRKNPDLSLRKKYDDFFPYASSYNVYWTGYYSSRPTLKRFERIANNFLQSTKQLMVFSRIGGIDYDEFMDPLREAMGVLQHHDAITGTAKQAVAEDYAKLLHQGIQNAKLPLGFVIGHLLGKTKSIKLELTTCLLANVSICEASNKDKFLVTVYNPLSRSVSPYIRLPVNDINYKILGEIDGQFHELQYDVFDTMHSFNFVKEKSKPSKKELVFQANAIPPLGLKLYYIKRVEEDQYRYNPFKKLELNDLTFGTEKTSFIVDAKGRLQNITMNGITLDVQQEFRFYTGTGSGAYVFKPINSHPMGTSISTKYARGALVDELLQHLSPELTQIIRVYKGDNDHYIEFDWLVGDLKTKGDLSKEVVTQFKVRGLYNKGIFYTDANGREQIIRKKDKRNDYPFNPGEAPVASNYYPVTSKIVMRDEDEGLEFAVLTDRPQGGTSLKDGTVELMVHRKLLRDDGFGVDEALKEEQYGKGLFVRGQHLVTFGAIETNPDSGKSTAAFERDLTHRKFFEPLILLADATVEKLNSLAKVERLLNFKFKGLRLDLPENVKILTLEPWIDCYLLRLEHVMEKNEDASLSMTTTVNLNNLFTLFNITAIAETKLGGFPLRDEIKWRKVDDISTFPLDNPLVITLEPMEIKTFLIKTDKINDGGEYEGEGGDIYISNSGGNILKMDLLWVVVGVALYKFLF